MTWEELSEICKTGGPLPAPEPVNPADLRRCWEFGQKIRAQQPSPEQGVIGIDCRMIEAELPGVDLVAVWLRVSALGVLQVVGALKEWERGTDFDAVVFQVAATFPFGGNQIDTDLFRQRLLSAGGAQTG